MRPDTLWGQLEWAITSKTEVLTMVHQPLYTLAPDYFSRTSSTTHLHLIQPKPLWPPSYSSNHLQNVLQTNTSFCLCIYMILYIISYSPQSTNHLRSSSAEHCHINLQPSLSFFPYLIFWTYYIIYLILSIANLPLPMKARALHILLIIVSPKFAIVPGGW